MALGRCGCGCLSGRRQSRFMESKPTHCHSGSVLAFIIIYLLRKAVVDTGRDDLGDFDNR